MTETLTIKTHQDLIDHVDGMLGFHPADSLVVVTNGGRGPTARVDIGPDYQGAAAAVADAYNKHSIAKTVALAYCDTEEDAQVSTLGFRWAFNGETSGRLWVAPSGLVKNLDQPDTVHVTAATTKTRADLEAELAVHTDPLTVLVNGDWTDNEAARWLHANVASLYDGTIPAHDVHLSQFVDFISRSGNLRDFAWNFLTRSTAGAAADWLAALAVRLQPGSEHRSNVMAVLAFASWLSGDGARAWVAVDQADDKHSLAMLVSQLLTEPVDPANWNPIPLNPTTI